MIKKLEKINFDKTSIREIQSRLDLMKDDLIRESENVNSLYNEEARFQFIRIANTIERKDILEMSPRVLEEYIKSLIAIIEFNTGTF